jgi:hypothetical protein
LETHGRLYSLRSQIKPTRLRAILHDSALYPEPDVFKPERFLNSDGTLRDDPILLSAFGFGKRICPGRHIVDATLFISVASLFSVLNIERGREGGGGVSDYSYTGGIIRYCCISWRELGETNSPSSCPNPFPCSFIPRDEKARELILADTMAR